MDLERFRDTRVVGVCKISDLGIIKCPSIAYGILYSPTIEVMGGEVAAVHGFKKPVKDDNGKNCYQIMLTRNWDDATIALPEPLAVANSLESLAERTKQEAINFAKEEALILRAEFVNLDKIDL